jgi:DNA-directed RNA polymerase subunit RPC12/RpoP
MIRFRCPRCGKTCQAEDTDAGKLGKCPGCGERIEISRHATATESTLGRILDLVDDGPTPEPPHESGPGAP